MSILIKLASLLVIVFSLVELENTVADVIGERYPLEFIDIVRASVDALLVVCTLDLANRKYHLGECN